MKTIFIVLFLSVACYSFGQNNIDSLLKTKLTQATDTIILKEGGKIPCKVYMVGDVTVNYEIIEDGKIKRRRVATEDVEKVIFCKTPETEYKDFYIPNTIEAENAFVPGNDSLKFLMTETYLLRKNQLQLKKDLKSIIYNIDEAAKRLKLSAAFSITAFCLGMTSAAIYLASDGDQVTVALITGSFAVAFSLAVPIEIFNAGNKLRGKP